MTTAPPVTVGVPVYNGEKYLDAALRSLHEQTFTDFIVIIGDNASTDGTEEIARRWCSRDERFSYLRNAENIGGARNSNKLLALAESPMFRWAYHDDLSAPELLERAVGALEDRPDSVGAWLRLVLIDENDQRIGQHGDSDIDLASPSPHERLEVLLRRSVGQVAQGLLRTEVARQAGGATAHVAGEMVLPLSLALRGPLVAVPGQLMSVRVHTERHGGNRRSEMAWADPSRHRMAFPYSRSSWLLIDAVRRAGLPPGERRRCEAVILWYWSRPRWRTLVGDLLRLPRDLRG